MQSPHGVGSTVKSAAQHRLSSVCTCSVDPFERESEFAMASPGLDQGALLLKRQLMGKLKPNTLSQKDTGRATGTFQISMKDFYLT